MNFIRLAFHFTVLSLAFAACGEAPNVVKAGLADQPPQQLERPPLDSSLQAFVDDYDRYFSDSMQLTGTPGAAVVIVKGTEVIFMKGYGSKASGLNEPVDVETRFRIGSMSKGFAGVLTGILVEKGYLRWDDPVQEFYPDFRLRDKAQAERVQVWHLLSHTTGLPYHAFSNLLEEGLDRQTIVTQYFAGPKLSGKEGEYFAYQNVAFSLIEPVLENATGKSYAQLLHDHIFQPGGLRQASCDFETMNSASNKALPHVRTSTSWESGEISPLYYDYASAGGVNASISDMGEWLKVLLAQKPEVVESSTLNEVFTPVIQTGKERRVLGGWVDRDSASYGMGWRILERGGDTLVYHAGLVNDFHGEIAFNRREQVGVCVLFNAVTPLRGHCIQAFFERWKNFFFTNKADGASNQISVRLSNDEQTFR